MLLLPLENWGLEARSHTLAAIFTWTVLQWLLSEVPMFITGLMGVSLTVLLGVSSSVEAFSPFAAPVIFLFLGGFLLAKSMESLGLDQKITMKVLSLKWINGSFTRAYLCLLFITAIFSMWISNTATTAMMLPIMQGLFYKTDIEFHKRSSLFLALAYAATIGGLATPIGSPPNAIALGMLDEVAKIHLTFFDWMLIAAPISFILLMILFWIVLKKIPENMKSLQIDFTRSNESFSSTEKVVMSVFSLTVLGWLLPSTLELLLPESTISSWMAKYLKSEVVVLLSCSILFLCPLNSKVKILNTQSIKQIDWGSLLLFGSGLSLGKQLFTTGLAQKLGALMAIGLTPENMFLGFLIVITFTIFFTEFTSNTASANILVPITIAASLKVNLNPMLPALIVAMSCNLAFMLPVATPPNAIVFGSGLVHKKDMIQNGFLMNIISAILLLLTFLLLKS